MKTSIQWPHILSGSGQLLAILRMILFCCTSLLNGQEDLKIAVCGQMKAKE